MNNKSYTFILSPAASGILNESRALKIQHEREDRNPPIFIKLLEDPFHNWIVSLEDIKVIEKNDGNAGFRFAYNICRVPKDVTDETVELYRDELYKLLTDIFNDMIEDTKEDLNKYE